MRDCTRYLQRSFALSAAAAACVYRRLSGVPSPAGAPSPTASSLWSWGRGVEGALGDGSAVDTQAVHHTGESWNTSAAKVYAGMWHSGAIVNGEVFMWGKGTSGRLGLSDEASSFQPSQVSISGSAVSLALGGQHTLAVVRASDSQRSQLDDAGVEADYAFEPYQLYSWGMGDYGCTGLCHLSSFNIPAEVRTFEALTESANVELPVVNDIPLISAGGQHSLVADRYGRVFACGRDEGDGRLGLRVPALESTNNLSIFHQVVLEESVVQIAAGGYASFALASSGKLYAWGSNGNGEQGSGQWAWSGYRPNLVPQLSDGRVKQMAAGGFHGAAVTHDGAVFTWGMGRQGALGHGVTSNCFTPTRVTKLAGVHIEQVCCGPTATAAVSQDGKLYVWGNNAGGMLGLGEQFADHQQVLEPEEVPGLQYVQSVALGAMHGLAVCA